MEDLRTLQAKADRLESEVLVLESAFNANKCAKTAKPLSVKRTEFELARQDAIDAAPIDWSFISEALDTDRLLKQLNISE